MLLLILAALLLVALSAVASATIVAVGYGGTALASDDGITWTPQSPATGAGLLDVTHDGTQWIAVGSAGRIFTSPGGPATSTWTWTQRATGVTNQWLYAVAADGNTVVAVGTNSAIMTATGTMWTPSSLNTADTLHGVASDGTKWVIEGGLPANWGSAASSTDGGYTWNTMPWGSDRNALRYDGTQWEAPKATGCCGSSLLTSPSGMAGTWTEHPTASNAGGPEIDDVATENGILAGVGPGGDMLTTAGAPSWAWTVQTSGTGANLNGVAKCEGTPWIAVGDTGTILTSPGGSATSNWTWTQRAAGLTTQHLQRVACSRPALACATTTPNLTEGGTANFSVTGGTAPFTWTAATGSPASLSNGNTFATLYGTAGTKTINVSDAGIGTFHHATTCTVTVTSPPPLSCGAAQPTIAIGSQAVFNAAGGTPPYTWTAPGGSNPGPAASTPFTTTYPNAATYTAQVTDTSYNQQTATCSVAVHHDCFETPVADFTTSSPEAAPGQSISFMDTGTGDKGTWLWDFGDGQASEQSNPAHVFASSGSYWVRLTVTAPYCPFSEITRDITIDASNVVNSDGSSGATTPLADAGADQTVPEGTTVHLAGSSRPVGARYEWTQTAGTPVAILAANTPNPTFIAPRLADMTPIQLTILLRVTDGSQTSPYDYVTVTVTPNNHAPIAAAGTLQMARPGQTVVLNGTGSTDADGDPLTYTWTQISGTHADIKNANAPMASFTVPVNAVGGEELRFQLKVSDGRAATNDSTMVIVAIPASAAQGQNIASAPAHVAQNIAATPTANGAIPLWTIASASLAALLLIGLAFLAAAIKRRKEAEK